MRTSNWRIIASLGASVLALVTFISAAVADGAPSDEPLPAVTSGEGRVTRTTDLQGKPAIQIQLPTVNAEHPYAEVTVGSGQDQITLKSWLVSTDHVTGGFGKAASVFSNSCSGSNPRYCTCISQMSRGFHPAYTEMNLQTSWNSDNSTVWSNVGQGNWHSADFPLWFNDITMWKSGEGTAYAYSDLTAEVKDGIGWFAIHVGNYHMWHQIDAWGNCTPYATWS